MKKLFLILTILIVLLLSSCAPQLTYVDGKKTTAALGTKPQDIRALGQAEMRHSVSQLGQQIAATYQLINEQYQKLLEQGPEQDDSTGTIYRQKLKVLQQMMTFSLSSLEVYGRVYAQPDDDKITKKVRTRDQSLTGSVVGNNNNSSGNSVSSPYSDLPGFTYYNGNYYASYDKEKINPVDRITAEIVSKYPDSAAGRYLYKEYLDKKNKLNNLNKKK